MRLDTVFGLEVRNDSAHPGNNLGMYPVGSYRSCVILHVVDLQVFYHDLEEVLRNVIIFAFIKEISYSTFVVNFL